MENRKRYTAIVLAAGSGRRMQSDTPKQFMELCGHPLVYYSLYAFEKSPVCLLYTSPSPRDCS